LVTVHTLLHIGRHIFAYPLAWVVRWRETGEERTEGDLFIGNSRSKYYWANSEDFVLEKGILWRKGGEGMPARRVVTKKFRDGVHPLLVLHFFLSEAL
jgi:hypothetical protein